MKIEQLDQWVKKLGQAWVELDVNAALSIVDKENIEWTASLLLALTTKTYVPNL